VGNSEETQQSPGQAFPDLGDRYVISRLLGQGAMGQVFVARDRKLGRDVAIKVLAPGVRDEGQLRRFEQEARAAGSLDHPNVLAVHDVGSHQGAPFIISELLHGSTLRERLSGGALPAETAAAWARQLAQGLAAAHEKGVIHRDLKPENLFLTEDGRLKILDFGIAKLVPPSTLENGPKTATGSVLGTLAYMSPEQVRGERADFRSDIFACGSILHEMLAGQGPFDRETAIDTAHAVVHDAPPALPAGVPGALAGVVKRCLEKDPALRFQVARELAGALAAKAPTARGSRWIFAVAGATALLLLAAALVLWRARPHAPAGSDLRRLAVLPLANISPQASDEYFAEGMTEQLISTLSQISGLRVIARTSVARYKAAQADVAEIGRRLGVRWLLEGSVRKDGDRLRITVQLIDVEGQEHLWSEDYDRQVKDVFAIQTDVARRVGQALRVRLGPAAQPPPTANPEALDAYLRGVYFLGASQRGHNEEAATDSAIAMFRRATEIDPGFAPAYSKLARTYSYKFFAMDPDPRWEQAAFVAAERALAIDGNLAEAHVTRANLAWTLSNHFPHQRVIRELRTALVLNPSLIDAHDSLGSAYLHIGLFEQALAELDAAMLFDPGNEYAPPRIARIHSYQGKYEQALGEFRGTQGWEIETALVLDHLGRREEALALLDSTLAATAPQRRSLRADLESSRAVILASLGRRGEAEKSIGRAMLGQGTSHFHHAEYGIASAYALLGDRQQALKWLEQTAEDGLPCYPLFERDPNLAKLRGDPRFAALLGKLKMQWDGYRSAL
jgi:non-specific serine/threonine protein kinase